MFLSRACSTFWSVTQSLLVRYQATIQAFEKDTLAFHMTPITLQLIKKPGIYAMILLFSQLPLVCTGLISS